LRLFHHTKVWGGGLNHLTQKFMFKRHSLVTISSVYDHHWKIMSYNVIKKTTYSVTPNLNVYGKAPKVGDLH